MRHWGPREHPANGWGAQKRPRSLFCPMGFLRRSSRWVEAPKWARWHVGFSLFSWNSVRTRWCARARSCWLWNYVEH